MRGRFSDHYIKGQLPHVRSAKTAARAALDVTVTPLGTGAALPPPPAVTGATPTKHKRGKGKHGPVYQTGHATDPGVTRYRPKVWMTRAEAGLDTVDEQADWRARLTAAQAAGTYYTMVGHRPAAPGGKTLPLWMPNTLAAVTDPIRGLDGVDQLIAGVTYLDGEDGARTVLRVVDPASYALDEELVGAKARRTQPPAPPESGGRHQPEIPVSEHELDMRVRGMLQRGVVGAVDDSGDVQVATLATGDGVVRSSVEVHQPYGFASLPPDAQPLTMVLSVGADQGHQMGLQLWSAYRFGNLQPARRCYGTTVEAVCM